MTRIYDVPESVADLFEQGDNSYRIIDYGIGSMDNDASMDYFLDQIGCLAENIMEDHGTQVTLQHPDYDFMIQIDSSGLGDFFSHGYEATVIEVQ